MLAPEINSARMYVGAGSAPMLAAAAAWNGLAAELRSAATAYQAVISRLTDEGWLGPASAAMAAAAAPYAAWMGTTATQAEQTAAQASAAASAYETAFAATVPPPAIAANRAQLASLVATNVLGQNAPAIAANEAQYGEMWAQDAAAMYGYAGNSAAASKVTPFSSPQPNTNPAGQLAQNAVVSQVTGTSTGTGIQNTLSQLVSALPNALQGLASPAASNSSGSGLGNILGNLLGGLNPFAPNTNTSTLGLSGLLNFADGQTNSAMGTFMNSTFTNGFVSAGYVSPALVSPAVTSALADINSLHYGAGGFPEFMPPPLGGGSGVPALSSAVSPAALPAGSLPGLGGGSAASAGMGRATLVGCLTGATHLGCGNPGAHPGHQRARHGISGGRLDLRAGRGCGGHARYARHARDADSQFGRTRIWLCCSAIWVQAHGGGTSAGCRVTTRECGCATSDTTSTCLRFARALMAGSRAETILYGIALVSADDYPMPAWTTLTTTNTPARTR